MSARQKLGAQAFLRKLRETGDYADLTLICGPVEYKVHKCVVFENCGIIKNKCQNPAWEESDVFRFDYIDDDDAEEDLSSDHPDTVKLLIDFMYNSNYIVASAPEKDSKPRANPEKKTLPVVGSMPVFKPFEAKPKKKSSEKSTPVAFWASQPTSTESGRTENGPLVTHARVYTLACKYFMTPLKYQAILKFKRCVANGGLQPEDFAAAIMIAYGTTPGKSDMQMRDCVFECITSHLSDILSEEITRAAIDQVGGLSMQLLVKERLDLYYQELTEPCFWSDDDRDLSYDCDSSSSDEE